MWQLESNTEYIDRLQQLYSLSETIIKNSSKIEKVYQTFLDTVRKLLKAQKAAILLFDGEGVLKFESHSNLSRNYIRKITHKIWGEEDSVSEPVLVSDINQAAFLKPFKEILDSEGIRGFGFFPLLGANKLLGKLAVYYKLPHMFDTDEVLLAQSIAKQIASLLERRKANIALLNSLADGVVLQDLSGKIIFANIAAVKAAGYSSLEEMIKSPSKWMSTFRLKDSHGEAFDISKLPGRRVLAGESYAEELIQTSNLKTGERGWFIVKAQPVFDEEGKLAMVTNIIHDITDRLELDKRKDEFISTASHEFKTPLAVLKGFIQIMQKEDDLKKSKYYLMRCNEQLDRLNRIVEVLLDLSRAQTGKLELKKEKFDIARMIKDTIKDIQLISSNHKIILQNEAPKSKVYADKYRVGEVLNNLVSNAVKFSPKADKIIISVKDNKQQILVEVKDFGIGIAANNLTKIFEPFFQATNKIRQSFGGLGLGLHISREIIIKHGGRIWVKSKRGEGSTFTFSLPV